MTDQLDLYHRTTEEAARAIIETGDIQTLENTGEMFGSTHIDGQAVGYGPAVVHIRVDEEHAQLDDEFPDGELHFRIDPRYVRVVGAFTVDGNGTHIPIDRREIRPGSAGS